MLQVIFRLKIFFEIIVSAKLQLLILLTISFYYNSKRRSYIELQILLKKYKMISSLKSMWIKVIFFIFEMIMTSII